MTAIFLAGSEVETLARAVLDSGHKYVLWSYYYILQMRRESFVMQMQDEYPDVTFFLDSGAFTYFAMFKREPEKLVSWKEFKRRYYEFIAGTWDRWGRIAELDLDGSFDEITDQVILDWREELLEDFPDAPITPVWHKRRGRNEWSSYCRDPRIRHLAIGSGDFFAPAAYPDVKNAKKPGGIVPRARPIGVSTLMAGYLANMVHEAHRWNKTVHGFAQTKINTILKYVPFDSVDSSSWLAGQKYGTMYVFTGNKFRALVDPNKKLERRLYRAYFKANGLDPDKVEKDDVHEVRKANVIAWKRLGERLLEIRKRQHRNLIDEVDGIVPTFNRHLPFELPLPRVVVEIPRPPEGDHVPSTAKVRDGTERSRHRVGTSETDEPIWAQGPALGRAIEDTARAKGVVREPGDVNENRPAPERRGYERVKPVKSR